MTFQRMEAREYEPVPLDQQEEQQEIELTDIGSSSLEPLHFEDEVDIHEDEGQRRISPVSVPEYSLHNAWNRWEEPCLPSCTITLLSIPILLAMIGYIYNFTDRFWSAWPFIIHLHLRLGISKWHVSTMMTIPNARHRLLFKTMSSLVAILDIVSFVGIYPFLTYILTEAYFREPDGTINMDWAGEERFLRSLAGLCVTIGVLRLVVCCFTIYARCRIKRSNNLQSPNFWIPADEGGGDSLSKTAQQRLYRTFKTCNTVVLLIHLVCFISIVIHFGPSLSDSRIPSNHCDTMDSTVCALPFPSFHHMKKDESSKTGWRVDLKGLPPLRGGLPSNPKFLNDLDGFSTQAPILFYMEGLKEAHEHNRVVGLQGPEPQHDHAVGLQGPERIEHSVTEQSITLLLNVDDKTLVYHSAEIDYLNPQEPLVLVIPAKPLNHNTHYALVVINASDKDGSPLPRSTGMQTLYHGPVSERQRRFSNIVMPALQEAAPWLTFPKDVQSIQMMFDFVTISEESQIGNTRSVRDATLEYIKDWNWTDHVELVKEIQHNCDNNLLARTLHINLDTPSFLQYQSRYSVLSTSAIETKTPVSVTKSKAIIQIPCSLQKKQNGTSVTAIMEYGHGLFYHRGEVYDGFLSKMANDNGYILMAMDWRGMSSFDMPVAIKTLLASPNLFQAVRDNLIQGYSNKLALQHFSQNGMLKWLGVYDAEDIQEANARPVSVFYGISQGGILGGGYMALSNGLIDRGILGSPGTPFASILTRSTLFMGYDILLLFNFYNNRHVRIMLSLFQMGWDSVESCGLLAPPISEPLPRILLQTGMGDPVVPSIAAEAMARAMNASTLLNNPRIVFDLPTTSPGNETSMGPKVTLSELFYEKEYESLPLDNSRPPGNSVHWCVRWDDKMIHQIEMFVNTGMIIDPCESDGCYRDSC